MLELPGNRLGVHNRSMILFTVWGIGVHWLLVYTVMPSRMPIGGSNVPFGSTSKSTYFSSHLNYLNLKTVWAVNIELSGFVDSGQLIASSPGPSQILSRSRGEKSGEGLGSKLRHGPEMVDSVST